MSLNVRNSSPRSSLFTACRNSYSCSVWFRFFLNSITFPLTQPLTLLPTGSQLFALCFVGSSYPRFSPNIYPFLCLYLGIHLPSNSSYSPTFHRRLTVLQFLHFSPILSLVLITCIQNSPRHLIRLFSHDIPSTLYTFLRICSLFSVLQLLQFPSLAKWGKWDK